MSGRLLRDIPELREEWENEGFGLGFEKAADIFQRYMAQPSQPSDAARRGQLGAFAIPCNRHSAAVSHPCGWLGNDGAACHWRIAEARTAQPSDDTGTWVIVAAHLSTEGVAYFWGPNFSGYTRLVEKAGRYTEAEAKRREVWSERMEVAVPLAEVIAASKAHVSDDDAHRWFRRRFPGRKPEGTSPKEAVGAAPGKKETP